MGYKLTKKSYTMFNIIKYIAVILVILALLATIVVYEKNRSKKNDDHKIDNSVNQDETNNISRLMNILSSEGSSDITKKETFEILKKEDIDLDAKDIEGKTPLMYAVFNNDTEIIEAIIKRDVDVNSVDSVGRTALHWASYYGNEDALILLLQNKVDISIKDTNDSTALDLARFEGHENIIEILESL